jgi:hypothetical protein
MECLVGASGGGAPRKKNGEAGMRRSESHQCIVRLPRVNGFNDGGNPDNVTSIGWIEYAIIQSGANAPAFRIGEKEEPRDWRGPDALGGQERP